jgi:hypothetical protein
MRHATSAEMDGQLFLVALVGGCGRIILGPGRAEGIIDPTMPVNGLTVGDPGQMVRLSVQNLPHRDGRSSPCELSGRHGPIIDLMSLPPGKGLSWTFRGKTYWK